MWLLVPSCVHPPATPPLPDERPAFVAPDVGTEPLTDASPLESAVLDHLRFEGGAPERGLFPDERLSRVARAAAWEVARGGSLPALTELNRWARDAGSPYLVDSAHTTPVPRGLGRRESVFLEARTTSGSSYPTVVGVGAWDAVVVLVFAVRGFTLEAPLAKEGAQIARLRLEAPLEEDAVGLLVVDAAGERLVRATAGPDGVHTVELPATDGTLELAVLDGPKVAANVLQSAQPGPHLETLGLLAVGRPPTLPAPAPTPDDPAAQVRDGADALRALWGLPAVERSTHPGTCYEVLDVEDQVEVLRDQRCVRFTVHRGDHPWDLVAERPLATRVIGWPRADRLSIAQDDTFLWIRATRRFERLDPAALDARLAAVVERRWPTARRADLPGLEEVLVAWAAAGRPDTSTDWSNPLVRAVEGWVGRGRYAYVLFANQEPDRLAAALPSLEEVAAYRLLSVLAKGPEGEPMYYAVLELDTQR